MSGQATLRDKGQITIPKQLREAAGLAEGDVVDVRITKDGSLVLTKSQTVTVPPDQEWFWTDPWQESMRQAREDVKAGRVTRHEDDKAFLASLKDA